MNAHAVVPGRTQASNGYEGDTDRGQRSLSTDAAFKKPQKFTSEIQLQPEAFTPSTLVAITCVVASGTWGFVAGVQGPSLLYRVSAVGCFNLANVTATGGNGTSYDGRALASVGEEGFKQMFVAQGVGGLVGSLMGSVLLFKGSKGLLAGSFMALAFWSTISMSFNKESIIWALSVQNGLVGLIVTLSTVYSSWEFVSDPRPITNLMNGKSQQLRMSP